MISQSLTHWLPKQVQATQVSPLSVHMMFSSYDILDVKTSQLAVLVLSHPS